MVSHLAAGTAPPAGMHCDRASSACSVRGTWNEAHSGAALLCSQTSRRLHVLRLALQRPSFAGEIEHCAGNTPFARRAVSPPSFPATCCTAHDGIMLRMQGSGRLILLLRRRLLRMVPASVSRVSIDGTCSSCQYPAAPCCGCRPQPSQVKRPPVPVNANKRLIVMACIARQGHAGP